MLRSLFISFEGIDGSGKSTQAKRLSSALRHLGYDVVDVREPGGTPLGEDIRSMLLDTEHAVSSKAELLLFSAARSQLVDTVIEPALKSGSVVIADRFADSSTAYQGGGRSLGGQRWFDRFNNFVVSGREPDRTYLIDITPQQALARRQGEPDDRIEQEGAAFYERVREAYLQLHAIRPRRIVRLDGMAPAEALHADILKDTLAILRGTEAA